VFERGSITKEVTVVATDRIGLLADVCELLGSEGIDINSISSETANGTAIIRLYVKRHERAKSILEGEAFKVMEQGVLVLRLADKPGELAKISRLLSDEKVQIKNVTLISRDNGESLLGLSVSNHDRARNMLKRYL